MVKACNTCTQLGFPECSVLGMTQGCGLWPYLFLDSGADAVQVTLTHQTERSHLPPQEHQIVLKQDLELDTQKTKAWVSLFVCVCTLLVVPSETLAKCQSMTQ